MRRTLTCLSKSRPVGALQKTDLVFRYRKDKQDSLRVFLSNSRQIMIQDANCRGATITSTVGSAATCKLIFDTDKKADEQSRLKREW